MSKNKKSIWIGEAMQRLLDSHQAGADDGLRSVSGILNAVADRYGETVRHEMPKLSVNEWLLIFDSLNGIWLQEPAASAVGGVAFGVADSIRLDALDKKWDVDGEVLKTKLFGMSFAQRLAVVDAAERFWTPRETSPGTEWRDVVVSIVEESSLSESDKR